jgi:hypothetical protein
MARELLMPLPAPLESNPSFEAGGAKAPAINLPGAFRLLVSARSRRDQVLIPGSDGASVTRAREIA